MRQENEYLLQGNNLPSCITDRLFDYSLFANEIYISDYNSNNHSYKFRKFAVAYEKSKNISYGVKTRRATIDLIFSDRKKNKIKENC